jgi:hypothetical protein
VIANLPLNITYLGKNIPKKITEAIELKKPATKTNISVILAYENYTSAK